MKIPKHKITDLLASKGCDKFGIYQNKEVWVAEDGTTIRLPITGSIDIAEVEIIIIEQLNISMWEYDYWLGQSGLS